MKDSSDPGASSSGLRAGRRFHLVERLGAGAFGEVYLAEQDSGAGFRRRVALKLLSAHVAHHGEAGRRMRDEARILGRLAHRHIVSVLDLVQLGPAWAVVMDYVPGADLDRVLEALECSDAYLSPTAVLEIGAAVAEAVQHAYFIEDGGRPLGVLHRDIKPGNVLLTCDGDVKVLDFGVARMNLDTRESKTGVRVGTERYMSPQRLVGDDDDLAGDVYAIAATLAELLLRYPIGKTPVAPEKHAAFVAGTVQSLRDMLAWHEVAPDEAASFVTLVESGLAEDPATRPAARDYADRLAALARAIPGESLMAFSRRFVPTVDKVLGRERELVDGVLSEGSTMPTAASMATRREDSATRPPDAFEFDEHGTPKGAVALLAPLVPTPAPAAPRNRGPSVVLGLGLLGALAAAALVIAWTWARPDAPTPQIAPTPPPVAVIAAPPPVTPEPMLPPVERTTPVAPHPVATAPSPRVRPVAPVATLPVPAITPDVPRVTRALVIVQDASAVRTTCGDISAEGSTSALLRKFPPGTCRVSVTWLGNVIETDVVIDRAREVACRVDGDKLSCR